MPDTATVASTLAILVSLLGIVACLIVARTRFNKLRREQTVSLGVAAVPSDAFYKLLALAALVLLPLAAIALANYHTFEGTHEVEACARCHVMRPMVTDLRDPASGTLAARHFRNRWIPENQCFQCHSDYGLAGDLEAKLTGYRHLARYTTRTYHEPIVHRGHFNNDNCLKCHRDAPKFQQVPSHHTVWAPLQASTMSCTNCHGAAHPTREQRTPGSADYQRLMRMEVGTR
jgi:nitrate/TMAO reductase-like tetraheme cytochrome c subunit